MCMLWISFPVTKTIVVVAAARSPQRPVATERDQSLSCVSMEGRYEWGEHGFKTQCQLRFFSCEISVVESLYDLIAL